MTETVSPLSRLVRIGERGAVTCWILDLPSEPFRNGPGFVPREIKQYLSDRNGPIRIQTVSLLVARYMYTLRLFIIRAYHIVRLINEKHETKLSL